MEWLLATLQIAVGAGLATTFDDNIYLTAFFGKVNRSFLPRHVVIGELIGFSILLSISLIGIWIGLALPQQTIGLMGILPILIGLRALLDQWLGDTPSDQLISAKKYANLTGFESRKPSLIAVLADRQTYRVSMVTISNGGNNLSIYIPLFASLPVAKTLVTIPVLYGFILTWLFLSYHLTRAPGIALLMNRYAPRLFPYILIWLGFRIMLDSGTLRGLI